MILMSRAWTLQARVINMYCTNRGFDCIMYTRNPSFVAVVDI